MPDTVSNVVPICLTDTSGQVLTVTSTVAPTKVTPSFIAFVDEDGFVLDGSGVATTTKVSQFTYATLVTNDGTVITTGANPSTTQYSGVKFASAAYPAIVSNPMFVCLTDSSGLIVGGVGELPEPVTTSFAYSSLANGFTGSHDDTSTAGQSYIPSTLDQGFGSIWSGTIRGSDAWIKATSHFPGAYMPSFDVSVDGGAFTTVTTGPEAGYYSLFAGLADTTHFVAFKRTAAIPDYVYINIEAATLKVTGTSPTVSPAGEWLEPGNLASKTITANGLVPTTFRNPPEGFGPGYLGLGRTPVNRTALDGTFNGTTYAKTGATGRQPFLTVKTTSTELYVVSQARYVNILIGSTITQYDSGTAANSGGGAVKSRRITGLPAGDKTMHVFPSCLTTQPQGQWFSVGVPAGQSFGTVTGLKRAHIWGDSITQGVQSSAATGDEQMSGLTDIPRAFTALGYTTGLFGVSGSKYADYQAATGGDIAGQLAVLTVTSDDVAYVALGQNSPTTAPEVTYFVNQLIAKGYGKVIVRGVLPTITSSHTAQNTIIKGAVDAIVDAKLVYIDPTTWTEFAVNTLGFRDDGIHLGPSGYDALLTRMNTSLGAVLSALPARTAPTLSLSSNTTYPPPLAVSIPVDSVENDVLQVQSSATLNFASPIISDTSVLDAAAITSGNVSVTGLSGITAPTQTYFRARVNGGAWSNVVKHGDTVAPTITSSASPSVAENTLADIALRTGTLTANEEIETWTKVGGADAAKFNLVGNVWTLNEQADFETKTTYVVHFDATDYGGNSSSQIMTLTVTDVSEVAASTYSPTFKHALIDLSNANLTASSQNTADGGLRGVRSNQARSGKKYFETTIVSKGPSQAYVGVALSSLTIVGVQFERPTTNAAYFNEGGDVYPGDGTGNFGAINRPALAFTTGDIIMVAFDTTADKIWFGKNGTWVDDPAAGTGGFVLPTGTTEVFAFSGMQPVNNVVVHTHTINFGATAFSYTVPTGFGAMT